MTAQSGQIFPYPSGITRRLLRAPIYLYRMGLGALLDVFHIMILTTRGRKSGQARFTPVEYRRHGTKYYAISAWGQEPDWFKNLEADPCITLRHGPRITSARAHVITDSAEALLALHLFRRPNPFVYDYILARLGRMQQFDARAMPDMAQHYTIVRFNPDAGDLSLPTVQTDLVWVLPVVAGGMALLTLGWLAAALSKRK
jgi:deazaflavin-dependent oxidoreductase (nitroreductase family)